MRSIIIPTYNHYDACLLPCLKSIENTDLSNSEIIVVANGCRDGTEEKTKELAKTFRAPIRIISSEEPLGYTVAVNVGIAASKGETVILMNDDILILNWGSNWLDLLEKPLLEDPLLAITGATKDIWSKGREFIVFSLVAIKRTILFEFGLLDEVFNPGAGEDCDLCLKVQDKGYKIKQVPHSLSKWETHFPLYHIGHMTCGGSSNWGEIARRNTEILEKRYPRTQEDRDLVTAYSKGLQNSEIWKAK